MRYKNLYQNFETHGGTYIWIIQTVQNESHPLRRHMPKFHLNSCQSHQIQCKNNFIRIKEPAFCSTTTCAYSILSDTELTTEVLTLVESSALVRTCHEFLRDCTEQKVKEGGAQEARCSRFLSTGSTRISTVKITVNTCRKCNQNFNQIETLFGIPRPVTPGPDDGSSSSYGGTPAPLLLFKRLSLFLAFIITSISSNRDENFSNELRTF